MAIVIQPKKEKPQPTEPPEPKKRAHVELIETPWGVFPFAFTSGPPLTLAEAVFRLRAVEEAQL